MSIIKLQRKSGVKYQAKLRGSDRKWITKVFSTKKEASRFEHETIQRIEKGLSITNTSQKISLNDFFNIWSKNRTGTSKGWQNSQLQMYTDYLAPTLGITPIIKIKTYEIETVLHTMKIDYGLSGQTRLHVYNLLKKILNDAIIKYQIITLNPVNAADKPIVLKRDPSYHSLEETKALMTYVEGKAFGIGIWVQYLCGLRIGEAIALRWKNIDFESKTMTICENYDRKTKEFNMYTKSRKNSHLPIPPELLLYLKKEKVKSTCEYVCTNNNGDSPMSYYSYYGALKRYCREANVKEISTHGLRHSTSEIYLNSGGTRDHLRLLYNHSSSKVTDIYTHDKGDRLREVANSIQILGS